MRFGRIGRRTGAWAFLVAFAASLVLPGLSARHLAPDPDERLAPLMARPDVVTADDGVAGDEHCPVCHWLHAISGAFAQPAFTADALVTRSASAGAARADRRGRSEVPALPSRAPPPARG